MSNSSTDNRFMEFKIGEQIYAIPLLNVKEVIQTPEITTVPNSPPDFEGMMNLRGQILGVFNVRKKLNAKAKAAVGQSPSVVVVIEDAGMSVGMIVDEVTKVLYAASDLMRPAPLKEDDPGRKYIRSVIQVEKDLVLVLNIASLLDLRRSKEETA